MKKRFFYAILLIIILVSVYYVKINKFNNHNYNWSFSSVKIIHCDDSLSMKEKILFISDCKLSMKSGSNTEFKSFFPYRDRIRESKYFTLFNMTGGLDKHRSCFHVLENSDFIFSSPQSYADIKKNLPPLAIHGNPFDSKVVKMYYEWAVIDKKSLIPSYYFIGTNNDGKVIITIKMIYEKSTDIKKK